MQDYSPVGVACVNVGLGDLGLKSIGFENRSVKTVSRMGKSFHVGCDGIVYRAQSICMRNLLFWKDLRRLLNFFHGISAFGAIIAEVLGQWGKGDSRERVLCQNGSESHLQIE